MVGASSYKGKKEEEEKRKNPSKNLGNEMLFPIVVVVG
jgi:hypothetical protein